MCHQLEREIQLTIKSFQTKFSFFIKTLSLHSFFYPVGAMQCSKNVLITFFSWRGCPTGALFIQYPLLLGAAPVTPLTPAYAPLPLPV